MTEADKAVLANIAVMLDTKQIEPTKALVAVYHLGVLAGKLEMARISNPVFDSALDIMSGKVNA